MPPLLKLEGERFGRLLVVRSVARDKRGRQSWECRCTCGNTVIVAGSSLTTGNTKSCGCINRERIANLKKTHGLHKTRTYQAWKNMRQRCLNPKRPDFKHYGGRGITVDQRWDSFARFFADMGGCPPGHEIDRIDNDNGYTPDNCRWAKRAVQMANTRRSHKITFKGKTQHLSQWARDLGIDPSTLLWRLEHWRRDVALTRKVP